MNPTTRKSIQDYIIDHGYTGVINEEHIDDILGSVLVSIWHKRVLCLNEFMQGMDLYGLASILSHSPDPCKPLFVKGHISDVDANYLAGALNPQYSPEGEKTRGGEGRGSLPGFSSKLRR